MTETMGKQTMTDRERFRISCRFDDYIDKHNALEVTEDKRIRGWAIACIGTKRVSYLGHATGEMVYDEAEAMVFPYKQSAANIMCADIEPQRSLFKYTRLVAVFFDRHSKKGEFPTVNGY